MSAIMMATTANFIQTPADLRGIITRTLKFTGMVLTLVATRAILKVHYR